MSRIIELIKTDKGKIITGIILAIGLVCILRMSFLNANMIIINGPPVKQTDGKIFNFDNKCYSYKTIATSCDNIIKNRENI